jgi:hypothetical protein
VVPPVKKGHAEQQQQIEILKKVNEGLQKQINELKAAIKK